MKKLFCLFLAALVVASSLTGCGGSPEASNNSSGASTSGISAAPADFPNKSIRVIVPFAAGGNTDLNARSIADIIQRNNLLPQPMVVTNIAGSNSMEGLNALRTADADGYTLICQNTSYMLAGNAMGTVTINYPDMVPVAEVSTQPCVILVSGDSPFNTVDDLLEYAKAHPGELNFGFVGSGSTTHLAAEIFMDKSGSKGLFKMVSYTSGADALTAQLGGNCEVRSSTAVDCARYVQSGELKALVVTCENETFPDVPTFTSLGYETEFAIRQGFFAPKGTPDAVVEILYKAIAEACAAEDYTSFCTTNAMNVSDLSGADWVPLLDTDQTYMNEIVKGLS